MMRCKVLTPVAILLAFLQASADAQASSSSSAATDSASSPMTDLASSAATTNASSTDGSGESIYTLTFTTTATGDEGGTFTNTWTDTSTSSIITTTSSSTTVSCFTQLLPDPDWYFDPTPACPGVFNPLPTQGALSGPYLTLFGFGLPLNGSFLTEDGTSTTYSMTCLTWDQVSYVSSVTDLVTYSLDLPCTLGNPGFNLTASGWNWHILQTSTTSTQEVLYDIITETMNSAGVWTAVQTQSLHPAYLFESTTPVTTSTIMGNVGRATVAPPMVVSIAGVDKLAQETAAAHKGGASAGHGVVGVLEIRSELTVAVLCGLATMVGVLAICL